MSRSTTWKTTSGRLTRAARCAWTWSRRPLTTAVSSCSRHVLVSRSEWTPRCSDITTSPWNLAHAACADTQPTASSQRHQHEAITSTVVLYQCRPTLGVLHQQLTRRAPHRHQQGSYTATSFLLLLLHTHTHTHTFNGPFSGTNQVSRYQKGKTNPDYTEAGDTNITTTILEFYPQDGGESQLASKLRHRQPMYRRQLAWGNGGDCPRRKLLIGRRPVRNWTRRTISSLFLCRELHLFLGKSTKTAATGASPGESF